MESDLLVMKVNGTCHRYLKERTDYLLIQFNKQLLIIYHMPDKA